MLCKDQVLQHIVNLWIFISSTPVALKVIYNLSLHLINPLCTLTRCAVTVVSSTVGISWNLNGNTHRGPSVVSICTSHHTNGHPLAFLNPYICLIFSDIEKDYGTVPTLLGWCVLWWAHCGAAWNRPQPATPGAGQPQPLLTEPTLLPLPAPGHPHNWFVN